MMHDDVRYGVVGFAVTFAGGVLLYLAVTALVREWF